MSVHPSDIDLQRLADEGLSSVNAGIVTHVRECGQCADAVRYARAAHAALRRSLADDAPPEDVLRRVIDAVSRAASDQREIKTDLTCRSPHHTKDDER